MQAVLFPHKLSNVCKQDREFFSVTLCNTLPLNSVYRFINTRKSVHVLLTSTLVNFRSISKLCSAQPVSFIQPHEYICINNKK